MNLRPFRFALKPLPLDGMLSDEPLFPTALLVFAFAFFMMGQLG